MIPTYLRFNIIGGFGVDIFFVISGFIMAYTINDSRKENNIKAGREFIKKRILRIYPLHLLVLIPILFIYLAKCIVRKTEISFYSIVGSFFLIPDLTGSDSYAMINPVEWTLVYEMTFYLSLSAFIMIIPEKKNCLIGYGFFIIVMITIVKLFDIQGSRLGWVNLRHMIGDPLFLDFIMGFLVYFLSKKITIKITTNQIVMILIMLCVAFVFMAESGLPRLVSSGIPAFILVLIFTIDTNVNERKNNFLLLLGGASYAIYLIHPLYIPAHKAINYVFPSIGEKNDLVSFLISLSAIITGVFVYKYIEPLLNSKNKKIT